MGRRGTGMRKVVLVVGTQAVADWRRPAAQARALVLSRQAPDEQGSPGGLASLWRRIGVALAVLLAVACSTLPRLRLQPPSLAVADRLQAAPTLNVRAGEDQPRRHPPADSAGPVDPVRQIGPVPQLQLLRLLPLLGPDVGNGLTRRGHPPVDGVGTVPPGESPRQPETPAPVAGLPAAPQATRAASANTGPADHSGSAPVTSRPPTATSGSASATTTTLPRTSTSTTTSVKTPSATTATTATTTSARTDDDHAVDDTVARHPGRARSLG